MHRRSLIAATGLALALPRLARAQGAWPDRPIRLIVPFPPAGGTDVISREIGTRIANATGWNIVADNRPGAGGNIGLDAVAKSPPDGYTIGMGQTANLAINPTLYPSIPFDSLRDFSLISLVAQQPCILVVRRASSIRSLADYIAAGRAQNGAQAVGHSGSGTVGHLAGEMFARRCGVPITSIPYRGAAPVVTDLLGGRIEAFWANPLAVKGVLESNDVRALAVTSPRRSRTFPEVPTVAELGYEGFEAMNWTGLVGPARIPDPIVARLNEEVRKALTREETIARLAAEGSEPLGSTPAEFRAYLEAEHAKWGRIVREGRITLD